MIPGAFPFRIIDDQLYVDGGVTGNIIYGGRSTQKDSPPAVWQKIYPNLLVPAGPRSVAKQKNSIVCFSSG